MITKLAAVAPADVAHCPRWLSFLNDAAGEDQELIDYLQRLCGYALTGKTDEHVLCFVYGPGGNGKSVFINTLKGIANDYASVAAMETFMTARYDPHPTALAKLEGARVVIASETEADRGWRESLIKSLTGGDPISARYMRRDYFEYIPQFTLLIVGNHEPRIDTVDDAIKRRMHVIPFVQVPKIVNRKLEEELQLEWAGILRWMIEGAVLWQKLGLTAPAAVVQATDEYLERQDVFVQWLEECCETGPDKVTPSVILYESWKKFAEQNDFDPGSIKGFSTRMKKAGFRKSNPKLKGVPTKAWMGIELRERAKP